jgi:hypothetical protein
MEKLWRCMLAVVSPSCRYDSHSSKNEVKEPRIADEIPSFSNSIEVG